MIDPKIKALSSTLLRRAKAAPQTRCRADFYGDFAGRRVMGSARVFFETYETHDEALFAKPMVYQGFDDGFDCPSVRLLLAGEPAKWLYRAECLGELVSALSPYLSLLLNDDFFSQVTFAPFPLSGMVKAGSGRSFGKEEFGIQFYLFPLAKPTPAAVFRLLLIKREEGQRLTPQEKTLQDFEALILNHFATVLNLLGEMPSHTLCRETKDRENQQLVQILYAWSMSEYGLEQDIYYKVNHELS